VSSTNQNAELPSILIGRKYTEAGKLENLREISNSEKNIPFLF
jgi:hypothetical protein